MNFDATGIVMNTFLKRLLARAPGDGMRVLVFLGIVVIVGAVVTDRAISKGKNVSLQVASFLTLTATAPTSAASEAQLSSMFPESK
jgi:hypothetical protein